MDDGGSANTWNSDEVHIGAIRNLKAKKTKPRPNPGTTTHGRKHNNLDFDIFINNMSILYFIPLCLFDICI